MGVFQLQERKRVRLFARTDIYGHFISCLVFAPKERFNTKLLQLFRDVLADAFNSQDIVFSTLFSESVLVRIHFMVRVTPAESQQKWDFKKIEQHLIQAGALGVMNCIKVY